MDRLNGLAAAIRKVALDPIKKVELSASDVSRLAASAKEVNEQVREYLSDLEPVSSDSHFLTLQLFCAAFDHARGLLWLLETNPVDMAGPALALHRSQIENFLRAVYLGFIADGDQIVDFLDNDFGIREKMESGKKWKAVGVRELAIKVEAFVNTMLGEATAGDTKLSSMVDHAWSPLCGFVHGGRAVHSLYIDGQGQIGGNISPLSLVQSIGNCYVVTNIGFLVLIARIYDKPGISKDSKVYTAMTRFRELYYSMRERRS